MITTKKHFELFVNEAKFWIDKLGIKGWNIIFTHKKDNNENKAGISWRVTNRVACINLEVEWGKGREFYDVITDRMICTTAFHEVCELFLARLAMMADGKMSNSRDLTEEETHNLIRTLENTMFKDSYDNRKSNKK